MMPSKESVQYYRNIVRSSVVDIVETYIEEFKPNHRNYFPRPSIKKFERTNGLGNIFSFGLLDIEQGSASENKASLEKVAYKELGYTPEQLIDILAIISGNQLTMDRWRSICALYSTNILGHQFT